MLQDSENLHAEELQDIIAKPPAWLLKGGITFISSILVLLIGFTSMIRYPESVTAEIKISAINSPKVIVSRVAGNIQELLVKDGDIVKEGNPIAYMESTANHSQVLTLFSTLKNLSKRIEDNRDIINLEPPSFLALGELQSNYQTFYQSYISFKASMSHGILLKSRRYLIQDIAYLTKQNEKISEKKSIQEQELKLTEQDYNRYRLLNEKKYISKSEFEQKEMGYLTKKYPLNESATALLLNKSTILTRRKELAELDNRILEEKSKFVQAINTLVSSLETWKAKYIISATVSGKILFTGILEENQYVDSNYELFYINPERTAYFGVMHIPQISIGKTRVGQTVLIKLRSYPYQEYGYLTGEISSISEVPIKDSVFLSRVTLSQHGANPLVKLKVGMFGNAEILTENLSVFTRIKRAIYKAINYR
jgi:HlyD family secretion protein